MLFCNLSLSILTLSILKYRSQFVNILSERVSFIDRIMRILERADYRRAETDDEKAAIFRMRHEAYTRDGVVPIRPSGMFNDALDETHNAWLVAMFIDGELASSLQLHVSASLDAPLPAMMVYSDVLAPRLKAGQCLIDLTRHVSRLEFTRQFPEMPYLTVRPALLAEEYFDADYIVGAVRVEHQGAFKRMFGMAPWAAPREYPLLKRLMPLLTYDCRASRARISRALPALSVDAGRTTRAVPQFVKQSRRTRGRRSAEGSISTQWFEIRWPRGRREGEISKLQPMIR